MCVRIVVEGDNYLPVALLRAIITSVCYNWLPVRSKSAKLSVWSEDTIGESWADGMAILGAAAAAILLLYALGSVNGEINSSDTCATPRCVSVASQLASYVLHPKSTNFCSYTDVLLCCRWTHTRSRGFSARVHPETLGLFTHMYWLSAKLCVMPVERTRSKAKQPLGL